MVALLRSFDWPNMLKDEDLKRGRHDIRSIMPVYYMDEADDNHFDRPRLDLVITFTDAQKVRYHPNSDRIWLDAAGLPANPADSSIIKKRRRHLEELRRKFGRDWER